MILILLLNDKICLNNTHYLYKYKHIFGKHNALSTKSENNSQLVNEDVIDNVSVSRHEKGFASADDISTKEEMCDCDCHILVGGSGKICPECEKDKCFATEQEVKE